MNLRGIEAIVSQLRAQRADFVNQIGIDTYVRILTANVMPLFKDTRIDVINNEMIQNHLTKAANDYSKSTLHMMMVVLGQILGWACKNDLTRKIPA